MKRLKQGLVRCAAACTLAVASVAPAGADEGEARWYTLAIEGVRTGWVREQLTESMEGWQYSRTWVVEVQQGRRGSQIRREFVSHWSPDDGVLRLEYRNQNGVDTRRWRGSVVNAQLKLESAGADSSIDIHAGTVMPHELESELAGTNATRAFTAFDPEALGSWHFVATPIEPAAGEAAGLRHVHLAGGERVEDWWFGADGRLERLETRMLDAVLTQTPCTQDCDAPVAHPYDRGRAHTRPAPATASPGEERR